jgi:hypothetical protein
MQMSRGVAASIAILCGLLTACERGGSEDPGEADADGPADDGGDSDAGALLATGEVCSSASECEGKQCIQLNRPVQSRVCSTACQDDADCQAERAYVCGTGTGGVAQCMPPCGSGVACVGGRPVLCSEVSGQCQQCGCPSGEVCGLDGSCSSGGDREVGVACQRDDQCKSQHCSASAGVCRVGAGQPCTASNCDLCIKVSPKAPTFCTRSCQRDSDCQGGVCTNRECLPRCAAELGDPYCPDGACQTRYPDGMNATETAYFCPCYLLDCTAVK